MVEIACGVLEVCDAGRGEDGIDIQYPVVATDVGDTREIVVDGETGFLVKPGDAVAVARSVIELLKDEGLRRKFGGRGREHVERNFSYDAVTEKVNRVYLDVLGKRV